MFVLSTEGPGRIDKRNWTTHNILGIFSSEEKAMEFVGEMEEDDEEIRILTEIEGTKILSETCV